MSSQEERIVICHLLSLELRKCMRKHWPWVENLFGSPFQRFWSVIAWFCGLWLPGLVVESLRQDWTSRQLICGRLKLLPSGSPKSRAEDRKRPETRYQGAKSLWVTSSSQTTRPKVPSTIQECPSWWPSPEYVSLLETFHIQTITAIFKMIISSHKHIPHKLFTIIKKLLSSIVGVRYNFSHMTKVNTTGIEQVDITCLRECGHWEVTIWLLFFLSLFKICVHEYLTIWVYEHCVPSDAHRGQRELGLLELELQAVVSQLIRVLGTQPDFSSRAISALTCWAPQCHFCKISRKILIYNPTVSKY